MSFSDNLENDLKNLESRDERDPAAAMHLQRKRMSQRAMVLAAAPHAESLKSGKFTAGLLSSATRIGHGLRTKVNIFWMGSTLRLEAREHRLELRPEPDGIMAHFLVNGAETRSEKIDLNGDPEKLAKRWLDIVGPRPQPEQIPDLDEDEQAGG
jgi:hypothetical protein